MHVDYKWPKNWWSKRLQNPAAMTTKISLTDAIFCIKSVTFWFSVLCGWLKLFNDQGKTRSPKYIILKQMRKIFYCISLANMTQNLHNYLYFGLSMVNARPLAWLVILVYNETRQFFLVKMIQQSFWSLLKQTFWNGWQDRLPVKNLAY